MRIKATCAQLNMYGAALLGPSASWHHSEQVSATEMLTTASQGMISVHSGGMAVVFCTRALMYVVMLKGLFKLMSCQEMGTVSGGLPPVAASSAVASKDGNSLARYNRIPTTTTMVLSRWKLTVSTTTTTKARDPKARENQSQKENHGGALVAMVCLVVEEDEVKDVATKARAKASRKESRKENPKMVERKVAEKEKLTPSNADYAWSMVPGAVNAQIV